jgi:putative phosphoesterase
MARFIGVISDTHGLLRPQALAALRGAALIIHAGDIGNAEVLNGLRQIAPTVAIRGNVDTGPWSKELSSTEYVEFDKRAFYVLHDLADLDLDPPTAGFDAVISGHTHQPKIKTKDGVLYVNPGSAGPRRFKLPISVGRLVISGEGVQAEIVTVRI